jgi:membrane-associated phospholipid phosphatase
MLLLGVQGLGSFLALLLFVWIVTPRRNPIGAIGLALRRAWERRSGRIAIAAVTTVITVNYLEGTCDPALTRWLDWDVTPFVRSIEGDFVGRLQAATPHALVVPLALVYVPGYLAILNAPLVLWTTSGGHRVAGRYALAFVLNYVVALPFFLLAPVREVGWSGLSTATPLLDSVWPGITEQLRAGSPLDNCFPSMHVSCAVTTLRYVHVHGPPRLRCLGWVIVPAIVLSTMLLGIHWATDVVAGVVVGLGCCAVADRVLSTRNHNTKRAGAN